MTYDLRLTTYDFFYGLQLQHFPLLLPSLHAFFVFFVPAKKLQKRAAFARQFIFLRLGRAAIFGAAFGFDFGELFFWIVDSESE
jgi:hypothetical protein